MCLISLGSFSILISTLGTDHFCVLDVINWLALIDWLFGMTHHMQTTHLHCRRKNAPIDATNEEDRECSKNMVAEGANFPKIADNNYWIKKIEKNIIIH